MSTQNGVTEISEPTNAGEHTIAHGQPYTVNVTIEGVADILFHRWNCEAVDTKAKAAKGSKAKKTDDIESYVYRNDKNEICIPGEYLRMAVIKAAKYHQDPRSQRKSAMDLMKASYVSLTDLASTGTKTWDYEDKRRVTVNRSGITRTRPALKAGWKAAFDIMINMAGRLEGLGDFRPTYGRFVVTKFDVGFIS